MATTGDTCSGRAADRGRCESCLLWTRLLSEPGRANELGRCTHFGGQYTLADEECLHWRQRGAAPAVAPAPCRWCKGTGVVDVSFGRGRLLPCLDCPAGAARKGA